MVVPVAPATWETKVGGSVEPMSSSSAWVTCKTLSQKKKKGRKKEKEFNLIVEREHIYMYIDK
jgi:hypothetical protein